MQNESAVLLNMAVIQTRQEVFKMETYHCIRTRTATSMIHSCRIRRRRTLTRNLILRGSPAVFHANLQIAVVLQVALRAPLLVHYSPSRTKNLIIHDHHHSQRDIKTTHGRVNLVSDVLRYQTHVELFLAVFPYFRVFVAQN